MTSKKFIEMIIDIEMWDATFGGGGAALCGEVGDY
jgi:hypothetical protein